MVKDARSKVDCCWPNAEKARRRRKHDVVAFIVFCDSNIADLIFFRFLVAAHIECTCMTPETIPWSKLLRRLAVSTTST
jgi:hypothetical protein